MFHFTEKVTLVSVFKEEGTISRIDEILHCKLIYNSDSAFDQFSAPSAKWERVDKV